MKCFIIFGYSLLLIFQVDEISGSCGVVTSCPGGFPVECVNSCGCLEDLTVDNDRINGWDSTFIGLNPGNYTKPTLTFSDCNKVESYKCLSGNVTVLSYKKDDGELNHLRQPNDYKPLLKYSCNGNVWKMDEVEDFDKVFYTCRSTIIV